MTGVEDMEIIKDKMPHASDIMKKMADNKKATFKIILIIIVITAAIFVRARVKAAHDIQVERSSDIKKSEQRAACEGETEAKGGNLVVDISGEINKPGVYKFKGKRRLYEVIEKAGGLKDSASTDSINRAGYVHDGDKIVIPAKTDGLPPTTQGSNDAYQRGMININSAGKEELMELPGVGEVIAERIMEYRARRRFDNPADIKNVSGIGEATFNKMKDKIVT